MQGTRVILGTYNTMPDGASGRVFELTYQLSWRPFLSSLYKFPNVSSILFYSGTVLQWIEETHPEFLLLLEEMVARKQIELLGGGFYSPLLSTLPPSDRVGQIELLTTYLRRTMGRRPSGGWLYEYLWDPSVPFVFRNSGLAYTFLPFGALERAGFLAGGRFTPIVTEDQRKLLYVFPTFDLDETFGSPPTFETGLESLMARYGAGNTFTLMADGNSIPSMWEGSGLESPDVMFEKSFAWFQKNCLDIESFTAQGYMKSSHPGSLAYLSSCASKRLASKVLGDSEKPCAQCSPAIGRQLILGEKASKRLYDKMHHVHMLTSLLRGDKARKKSAQEDLWKAQSGDAYWQGALGGIRRPEVRQTAYRALIEAEKSTRLHGSFSPGLLLDDIDCDGDREIIYQGNDIDCYVHARGASVFELDSFRSKTNYCATYPLGAEADIGLFSDRFYSLGSMDGVLLDLADAHFQFLDKERSHQRATFTKEVLLKLDKGAQAIQIRKSFLFQKFAVSVDYEIINRSSSQAAFRFATSAVLQPASAQDCVEVFASEGRNRRQVENLDADRRISPGQPCDALEIRSRQSKEYVEIRSDKSFFYRLASFTDRLAHAPYMDFAGGENLYQGLGLLVGWDATLPPEGSAIFSLTLHLMT